MITGRDLINEYYDYEDERLYSTGDDYLDEMLEKAFCEGYEYAQKEFAMSAKGIINRAKNLPRQMARNARLSFNSGRMAAEGGILSGNKQRETAAMMTVAGRKLKANKGLKSKAMNKFMPDAAKRVSSDAQRLRGDYVAGRNTLVIPGF